MAIGWVWVNGPVFVLLFGPLGAALFVTRGAEEVSAVFFATAFFGGFAAAWLWWSVMLPKWRLWSYARVANPLAIKYRSVEVQLAWPDGSYEHFEGTIHGSIVFPPRGKNGFGYDPIFQPYGWLQTFGEMLPEEKHSISHRARAFDQFCNRYLRKSTGAK